MSFSLRFAYGGGLHNLELTGRGLPRKPVPEKVRTVAQSPGPPALPKLGLLTMRRNSPAVPLHGTRVEVLRGELAAPWRIAFLIFRKLSNFEQSPGIPPV